MHQNIDGIEITIDGTQFTGRDLNEQGKELLKHIMDIRDRKYECQFQLAQLEVLDNAFTEALRSTVPKQEGNA